MGAKAKSKHRPARGIRHILSTCKGKHSRANEAFMCKKMPSTPSKVRSYQTSARPIRLSRPEWGVWSSCVAGKARQAFHSWWGLGMGLGMEPWSCCACHVVLREARGRDRHGEPRHAASGYQSELGSVLAGVRGLDLSRVGKCERPANGHGTAVYCVGHYLRARRSPVLVVELGGSAARSAQLRREWPELQH